MGVRKGGRNEDSKRMKGRREGRRDENEEDSKQGMKEEKNEEKQRHTLRKVKLSRMSTSTEGHQADQAAECFQENSRRRLPIATTIRRCDPPGRLMA